MDGGKEKALILHVYGLKKTGGERERERERIIFFESQLQYVYSNTRIAVSDIKYIKFH